jgi:uncharacterized protein YjdB
MGRRLVVSVLNRVRVTVMVALVGAGLGACSSAVENGSTIDITVTPSVATVPVGTTLTLGANLRDPDGNALSGVRVSWSSEDPTIATVSQTGLVTGVRVGSVLIAASARGQDAFARLTISPAPVASVRLSAANQALFVGDAVQLTAEPLDGAGNVLARPVTWSTSNESVASVTADGLVSAIAPGGAIITAASEGRSAVASITVTPVAVASIHLWPDDNSVFVGQTTQLTADLRDATGAPVTGRLIAWSSSNASVATVTSQGVVSAVAPGTATISAAVDGISASVSVVVSARPASAVIVSPGSITIFSGQVLQLSALVTDDRGQVLTGRPITYASNNPQVATVSSTGVVTGVGAGVVTITATSESASGTATITVAPEPVASLAVSPSSATMSVGQPLQLTVIARNASGQPLSLAGRTVTWSTSTPGITSVSAGGLVTALAVGTGIVVVSVDGRQASATLTVKIVPVVTVAVTPATATVTVGNTTTLTATPRDSAGQPLYLRAVTWSSSNSARATVNASGVVTGVSAGAVTITATIEGKSGSSSVTVAAVPVATVTVTPAAPNVTVGQTVQLTATPFSATGQPLTGRTTTWSSSASAIATVSSSGLVTGVSAGSAVITATIEGKTATATVTVSAGQIATVTVAPLSATVNVAWTTNLTATARNSNGTVISGVTFTWSSSNASIATVSSTGVVTGVAPGNATISAVAGGKTGSSSITVQLAPVDRIVVTPANPSVKKGNTIQLTATLYDAQNNVLTGRTVTWTSSNTNRATVSSTGVVTAISEGNVTITASSGGKSGSTVVAVTN